MEELLHQILDQLKELNQRIGALSQSLTSENQSTREQVKRSGEGIESQIFQTGAG
jgi:hypothetical protein